MRTRVSRITLAGVSAFALALPLLPLMTTPAVAATGDPVRELRLADPEGDGSFAVYGTSATPLVGNTNTLDVEAFGQSTDGARFVAVETSHNSAGTATASRVVVHDVSGRAVRTMATLTAPNGVGFDRPELSPDGNRVAWERDTYNASTGVSASTSYEAAISGGAVRSLGDVQPEAYLDNQSVLVHHNGPGYTYSVDALDGSGGAVDLPTEVYSVSVSRDGTQLLYSWFTGATIKLQLAAFDRASLAVTGVQTLDTDHDDIAAVFAPVDGQIDFCRYDSSAGDVHQHIWRMAATAGATASRLNPNDAADIDSITSGSYDAVKPASATAGPATLAGTSATVRWTLPAGADVAGARISRTLSSGGAAKVVDVNAPAASYNDSGLTVGSTYAYTFETYDRSGNFAPPVTRRLTATGLAFTLQDPTSKTALKAPFTVKWAASAPSTVKFAVSYAVNGSSAYTTWVNDQPGVARTFGSAAASGIAATTSTPGNTYRFKAVGKDGYGNSTATLGSAPASVPFDQTRATLSGGSSLSRSDAYLGTLRLISTTSSYARLVFTGSNLRIIGERNTNTGVMDIYEGSARIGSIDTHATSRVPRSLLFTKTYTAVGSHTITIKPHGTAGRPRVALDGFAVRR